MVVDVIHIYLVWNTHSCKHDEESIPNTYNRGKRQIDYILCSPTLVHCINKCGFYPFHHSMKTNSDHRIIYCNFDADKLLQTRVNTYSDPFTSRKLFSKAETGRTRYLHLLWQRQSLLSMQLVAFRQERILLINSVPKESKDSQLSSILE